MALPRESEQELAKRFTFSLFWALDSWVTSLKKSRPRSESLTPRQEVVWLIEQNALLPVSKLAAFVDAAYTRGNLAQARLARQEWKEVSLNQEILAIVLQHRSLYEDVGSHVTVTDLPRVIIRTEAESHSNWLFLLIVWWILGAWPDSQIVIDFALDETRVKITFRNLAQEQILPIELSASLSIWSCLIEYLTEVEHHGQCIWPTQTRPKELTIILPLHPPVDIDGSREPMPNG